MDYPSKRRKTIGLAPVVHNEPDGSKSDEGCSGSAAFPIMELQNNSNRPAMSTTTTAELRKRNGQVSRRNQQLRPQLPRLQGPHAGLDLVPRAPENTVTRNIMDVVIDDGTSAVASITLTDPTGPNTVSVSDVGVVTISPASSPTVTSDSEAPGSALTDPASPTTGQSVLSPSSPPASPISSPSRVSLLPAVSGLLDGQKNLTASLIISTGSHTTVTETTIIDLATTRPNHTTTKHITLLTTLSTSSSSHSTGAGSSASGAGAVSGTPGTESPGATASGTGVAGIAGTATASGSGAATSTGEGNGSNSSHSNGPPTPTVVGSVVGGVAGLTVILLVILLLIRYWKRKSRQRDSVEGPPHVLPPAPAVPPMAPQTVSQRSSHTPLMAALSPATIMARWRTSSHTAQTFHTESSSTTAPGAERGFQKIAGRKINPVWSHGGDGYGGESSVKETTPSAAPSAVPFKESSVLAPPNVTGRSFYRDSRGFYGGVGEGSPRPSGQAPREGSEIHSADDGSDFVVMRPSPARTPITSSAVSVGQFPSPPQLPSQLPESTTPRSETPPPPPVPIIRPRDALGRSHPSFDASRGSRFTESI